MIHKCGYVKYNIANHQATRRNIVQGTSARRANCLLIVHAALLAQRRERYTSGDRQGCDTAMGVR